jgi:alpha-amylase
MAIRFLFAVHNHQPVGNFEHVLDECTQVSYRPFLEVLRDHPGVRLALHCSGPLLLYFEKAHPEVLDIVGTLVDRGQIELIGGGFYEPILPVIPHDDAVGQVRKMQDWLRRRFGVEASGLWLTERVWEPGLPSVLAEAGVRFTLVDDTQFLYAGIPSDRARGYWTTEDLGHPLALFPVDMQLRYLVPFRPVDETLAYFRGLHDAGVESAVTLGDDGEKFGVWPDTYRYVYEEGYLHRLFEALEANAEWLVMSRFDEELERRRPEGRVYLPTASYEEMMEWVLPTMARREIETLVHELKEDAEQYRRMRPFVRGGSWRGYFAKYPESDKMHKRMLRLSRRLRELGDAAPAAARDGLWQGQCNCAYWHGLFGGLYLGHLRDGILRPMVRAERLAEQAERTDVPYALRSDFDGDGAEEFLLRSDSFRLLVDPAENGAALEFDHVASDTDMAHVLARRPEAYHGQVAGASVGDSDGDQPASIHEIARAKEEGLEKLLVYDRTPRRVFQDGWIERATTMEAFERGDVGRLDAINAPYDARACHEDGQGLRLVLNRSVPRPVSSDGDRIAMGKEYRIGPEGGLEVVWTVENVSAQPWDAVLFVDLNMTVLSPIGPDRWLGVDGDRRAPAERRDELGVEQVELGDATRDLRLVIEPSEPAGVWAFPVETVSSSESGFERTYQGTCLTFRWGMALDAGETAMRSLRLSDPPPEDAVAVSRGDG